MKMIGVDVGGTFTDLVYSDTQSGAMAIHKVSTTPADPSKGVMRGIVELCDRNEIRPDVIDYVFHGTTTATNAVLEGKGAICGMITNEGFRDILHIGRHQRPAHYSIRQDIPWQARPLIRRRHRKTVPGRLVPPSGAELVPLDEDAVRRAARELRADGVEAVAICFLFSFINPDHENRARDIVREEMPDAFVTTSSYVSPQFREFERFTTAALACFIGPKVDGYIARLDGALKELGMSSELRVMASNGGAATPKMVVEQPALTLQSGLAAGVLGGAWIGQQDGRNRLITFDIGGTSADIGIVVDGKVSETDARSTSIAGFPLLMPMLDIHTIGAGGGSIAWQDRGGAFRVGPHSAGAEPGPAAYGRGGTEPTVTDANVVLGRLPAQDFLGGEMGLDVEASRRVIADLAARLNMSAEEAAEGVLTILNANMANAIRSRTIQKGIDPRGFALVAMGGAGPLHGADVARMLSIPEVLVPPHPGITSAMGLLTTDLKYDLRRTQFQVSDTIDLDRMNSDLNEMMRQLTEQFARDNIGPDQIHAARTADLRYQGQGYELSIALPGGIVTNDTIKSVWQAFHAAHKAEYGHDFQASPIEVVNLRCTASAKLPKLEAMKAPQGGTLEAALVRVVDVVFRIGGTLSRHPTAVYRRAHLPADQVISGPAIVTQKDSTTVVPPDAKFRVLPSGSLLITMGEPT